MKVSFGSKIQYGSCRHCTCAPGITGEREKEGERAREIHKDREREIERGRERKSERQGEGGKEREREREKERKRMFGHCTEDYYWI